MFVAMAQDIRVLVIKLADRLHNMQTLEHLPRDKQKRIAQETLDIYAALAHRLGMQRFKLELEDLAFQTLHPKRYEELVALVDERNPERDAYLEACIESIEQDLREVRIKADVTGRPKHYYSIYEKMVLRGKEFDEIHDLVAIRIIVNSVPDCYAALGQIHARHRPVQNRFKDWIANPKQNAYQSLHTTVIGPEGRPLEIQIRTLDMHHTAEYGVAAHWKYKEGRRGSDAEDGLPWVGRLVEWQAEFEEAGDYLEAVRIDLYQDETFALTPRGDVISLPKGSNPVDFAYAIHTEVGHRCIGARVNDRLVPLDHVLQNGDTVEILTSKAEDAGPSRDWLTTVRSTRARSKIRSFFNRERREDAEERGRDAVSRALRRRGMSIARAMASGELQQSADELGYASVKAMYRAVGENHLTGAHVAAQLARLLSEDIETEEEPDLLPSGPPVRLQPGAGDAVSIEGERGMLVKLAKCCMPVPGDEIIGYVTRGQGVSVHRRDCPNVPDLATDRDRLMDVEWSGEPGTPFMVAIAIEALDRKHLLRDITAVLGDLHINILSANVTTRSDRVAMLTFNFELADPTHLEYAMRSIRDVPGVYDAYRLVQA